MKKMDYDHKGISEKEKYICQVIQVSLGISSNGGRDLRGKLPKKS